MFGNKTENLFWPVSKLLNVSSSYGCLVLSLNYPFNDDYFKRTLLTVVLFPFMGGRAVVEEGNEHKLSGKSEYRIFDIGKKESKTIPLKLAEKPIEVRVCN